MNKNVVFDRAVVAFAQFYPDSDTDIVVDVVVRRAVVEIDTKLVDRLRFAKKLFRTIVARPSASG